MAVLNQDISFYSGEIHTLNFTLTDAEQTPNVPLDLTNLEVKWALSRISSRTGRFSTTPLLEKCSGDANITITDAANGQGNLSLTPTETAGLEGTYHHQMIIEDALNNPTVVLTGTVTVLRRIVQTC